MSKTSILTKINAREDGNENPVSSEREISSDLLNELFSETSSDDHVSQAITTRINSNIEYQLTVKVSGSSAMIKISVKNVSSSVIVATNTVPVKIFDWKDNIYKPSIFGDTLVPIYYNSVVGYMLFINNVGLWLYSSLPPSTNFYTSQFVNYPTRVL